MNKMRTGREEDVLCCTHKTAPSITRKPLTVLASNLGLSICGQAKEAKLEKVSIKAIYKGLAWRSGRESFLLDSNPTIFFSDQHHLLNQFDLHVP